MKLDDFKKECVKKSKELKLEIDKIYVSFSSWSLSEDNNVQCCYYLKDNTTIAFNGDTPEIAFLNLEHQLKIEEARKNPKNLEPLSL